jgi:cyclophilin family peptidyl-prolyl cis-trans isomerase/HEAT repeat protein
VRSWTVESFVHSRRLRTAIAIVASGIAASCAVGPAAHTSADPTPAPAAILSDADAALLATLLAAADARRPDTTVVDRALGARSPFVRAYAVRTVGQIGISARAARLRALLADADSMVAADAAFALGLLHDSAATPALTAALAGPPTVMAAAAWSLGELGETARSSVERVLRTGQPTLAVASVLQASAKLRPVPVGLVVPYLADADIVVRRSAAYAVTRSRVPSATGALLQAWERIRSDPREAGAGRSEPEVELRTYLARGLAKPVAGDSLAARALSGLRQLIDDDQPHVRINAVRSLATFGIDVRGDLVRRLRDPDANVRIATAQSLGGVLSTATEWSAAWAADTGFTFRRALAGVALRAGVRLPAIDPAARDAWQRHGDWRRRAAAAEASGGGSLTDVDAIAVPLLRDRDARVRTAAFRVAAPWADSTTATNKPYVRSALITALADSDVFVRATILDALRPRARAADAAIALREWRRAARDFDNDARLAALRVIATAWTADSGSFGAIRDSLVAIDPPADPLEREIGRTVGPWSGWSPRIGTSRPTSWYAEQIRAIVAPDLAGHPAHAIIASERGQIEIVLRGADAPLTVANFVGLARRRYFDRLAFHRVVPNFVAQDGDPRGDGNGGPGYAIRDELNRRWYDRGAVGMALSGADTGGSQYFLTHSAQPHLDGHYTVFGHVIAGFDALDMLVQDDRIASITVR